MASSGAKRYSYIKPDPDFNEEVFKIIETDGLVSQIVAGFNEERMAIDFCNTWNGHPTP